MDRSINFARSLRLHSWPRTAALILVLVILCQPVFWLAANAQGRPQRGAKKQLAMNEDQRIAHVLSRLTFGARPGDFERVKAMGVEAFINQQLDPDSLDAGSVIARLKKLPTLGMATPVIIEQYNPPKPAAVPSPVPAKSAENANAPAPQMMAQNPGPLGQTPQIANPNMSAMQNEMQMEVKKEDAGRMPAVAQATP